MVNNPCLEEDCTGKLRVIRTGGFRNGVRVLLYKCDGCGTNEAGLNFFIPINQVKYGNSGTSRWITIRNPLTVDLDPELEPEILVHCPQ